MPGRPRKPSFLKVVTGTARHSRLNKSEPRPPRGRPKPPPHLSKHAREIWPRLCKILDDIGVLTEVDGLALESLAETYSDLRNAREALAARGGLVYATTNVAGNAMHRSFPELALIDAADRRFRMWCSAFGLSPSDRSKVSAVDKAELDPAERYFQRKSHPD